MKRSGHILLLASAIGTALCISPLALAPAFAEDAPAAGISDGDGWQQEFQLWRSASKTGKLADYQAYLKAYPNGKFARIARSRVDNLKAGKAPAGDAQESVTKIDAGNALKKPAAADKWDQDYERWKAASDSNTLAGYRAYLKAYPQGKFAELAQARIVQFGGEQPLSKVLRSDSQTTGEQDSTQLLQQDEAVSGDQSRHDDSNDSDVVAVQPDDQYPDEAQQDFQPDQQTVDRQDEPEAGAASLDKRTRREVMERLSSLGYDAYSGRGNFWQRSGPAVSQWQADRGEPATGYLTPAELDLLRADSERSYTEWRNSINAREEPAMVMPRRSSVVVIDGNSTEDGGGVIDMSPRLRNCERQGRC